MSVTGRAFVVVLSLLALCASAYAQVAPPESTRGLFGSGSGASARTQLDFNVTLNEGYDSDEVRRVSTTTSPTTPTTNPTTGLTPTSATSTELTTTPTGVPASTATTNPVNLTGGGFSTLLRTGANYTRRGKAEFAARANAVLRYYSDIRELQSVGHSVGVGLNTTTVGGLKVLVNQSAAYSPASFYGLFPTGSPLEAGDPGVTTPNYTVSNNYQTYIYTTSTSLTRDIGRRSYVTATGEFMYTDRLHETATWSDIRSYSVGGRYSRNVTRNVALSTELRYRSGEYGYSGGGTTTGVALDVGFDYRRPVSATRRITVGAHVGVSGDDYPASEIGLVGTRRQQRVVGDGGFSVPLTQAWFATASLRRGVEYETNLPTPVVNNAARISVTGLVASRVNVDVAAGYARGDSVFNSETLSFDTYTGEVGVRYAVSRNLAVNGGYLYYNYNIHNTLLLPGLPPGLRRNGVRVGLTLWAPALRR